MAHSLQLQQSTITRCRFCDSSTRSISSLTRPLTFMTLPVGIRLRIYHFVTPVIVRVGQRSLESARGRRISAENYELHFSIISRPLLLLVSKRIREEVKSATDPGPVVINAASAAAFTLPHSVLSRVEEIIIEDLNFDCLSPFKDRTTASWYKKLLEPRPATICVESPLKYNKCGIETRYDVHFAFNLLPIIARWLQDQRQGYTTSVAVASSELPCKPRQRRIHTKSNEIRDELQVTLKSIARFEFEGTHPRTQAKLFQGNCEATILWDGKQLQITELPDLRNEGWWKMWVHKASQNYVKRGVDVKIFGNSPTWSPGN